MAFSTETDEAPRMTRAVQALIAISVAIFFLQMTVLGRDDVANWLAFKRNDLTHGVWTVVTYAFVHGGFWHLFGNMFMLWQLGPRVEHQWSAGRFVAFYLWCALGGVLGHLMFGGDGILMGASAAVLGVMLAYAMFWPVDELLLFGVVPLKVKWLVTAYAALNLVQGVFSSLVGHGPGPSIAYMAHLGGMAFAWFYLRTPSAQSLDRLRQRISPVADIPDETPRAVPRSTPRPRERQLPSHQLLVPDPLRLIRLRALSLVQIRLVLLVVPLEPHRLALSLERQHVRRHAIEKPAIV